MEETLKQLKPIERLFLISKEREEVYTKKQKVFCLLYSLISNKNLLLNNNKTLTVNHSAKKYPAEYEMNILTLIDQKKFIELNTFIDKELVFNKTLVDLGIFKEEVRVKRRLILFNKASTELIKTTMYHRLQGHFSHEMESKSNVIKIVCENPEYFNKSLKAYSLLKGCMKKAADDAAKEILKKKEEKKKE